MRILLVFFLKILGSLMGAGTRRAPKQRYHKSNFGALTNVDKVKALERRRQEKGYRREWLYYRCKEEGLFLEYNQLYGKGSKEPKEIAPQADVDVTRFSFGKYKGQLVKEVWNNDQSYIQCILQKVDWDQYPNEEYVLEHLANNLANH